VGIASSRFAGSPMYHRGFHECASRSMSILYLKMSVFYQAN
jgi:hypothetical protein